MFIISALLYNLCMKTAEPKTEMEFCTKDATLYLGKMVCWIRPKVPWASVSGKPQSCGNHQKLLGALYSSKAQGLGKAAVDLNKQHVPAATLIRGQV